MTDLEAITESLEHWRDNLRLLADGAEWIPRNGKYCALCSKHFHLGISVRLDACPRCPKCPFCVVYGTTCRKYWKMTNSVFLQKTRILGATNLVAQLYTMQQEYERRDEI